MHVSPSTGPGDILDPVSIPKVIPLFPLPNLVFFPRTYVPLHIFDHHDGWLQEPYHSNEREEQPAP